MTNNRIKELRLEKGWNQSQLAEKSGFTQAEISRWEKATRPINSVHLAKIADALNCKPSDLLGESVHSGPLSVPVVAYVGAGAQVYPIDDHAKGDGLRHVECPPHMNPSKTVAVEVQGDSMEPLISEGFILYYDKRHFGVPDAYLCKICIVKVVDGPTLVKKLKKGNEIGKYKLVSLNPSESDIEAEVEWSAVVKFMGQL